MLSICRPVCRPVTSALTESRPTASVSGAAWDAGSVRDLELSSGNTVATSDDLSGGTARSSTGYTGKRRAHFVPVFVGPASDNECLVGVALEGFNPQSPELVGGVGYALAADGTFYNGGSITSLPITFASGDNVYCDTDSTAGKGWFDTDANAYAVDREAGTNPHFTFTPGALVAATDVYASDETPSASVTLASSSSGSFAAIP